MAIPVFNDHNGRVDQNADCQRKSAERHDVAADMQEVHGNEGGEQGDRQSKDGNKRRAEMEQESNCDKTDHKAFEKQVTLQGLDRFADQAGAIIASMDFHSRRKRGSDFGDLSFDSVNDI